MLSQVTFEQIKDNFWYGLYGEFRVIIDKSDGYVNATKICSSGGKQFYQWTRNEANQRLKKALEGDMVLDYTPDEENALQGTSLQNCREVCKYVQTENKIEEDRLISGTYMHPDLVPSIAGWISPEFQLKANRVVNRYIVDEWKTKLEASERAATQLLTSLHHTQAIATGTQLALQTSVDQNHQLQETIKEKDTMIEV